MATQNPQGGGKFVERFEMAIMQYAILNKAQQQGGVTKENLNQLFRGDMKMEYSHLDDCLQQLVSENRLKQEANKYTITDDGREDIQKVQHLIVGLPNVVGVPSAGRTQQPTTAGYGATTGTSPGAGGQTRSGSRGMGP